MGVYGGLIDKFPIGAIVNKALTLRTGQMHGQRSMDRLIEHVVRGEVNPSMVATHELDLRMRSEALRYLKTKKTIARASCSNPVEITVRASIPAPGGPPR